MTKPTSGKPQVNRRMFLYAAPIAVAPTPPPAPQRTPPPRPGITTPRLTASFAIPRATRPTAS
jgi:hypothetical protein